MQQSLTSENAVGQVPGLMPMKAGVSLGLAGGRGMMFGFFLGTGAVLKQEIGIFAVSSQNNNIEHCRLESPI